MGMAICVLFLTVSCQKEELNTGNGGVLIGETTITAMMETLTQTRTELGDFASGKTPVIWTAGDVIKAFSASASVDFTLLAGSGSGTAQFTGTLAGDMTHAIYPSSVYLSNGNESGKVNVKLPGCSKYVKDNIATGSYPTVSQLVDGNLEFKNLCGIFKLQLTGTEKVTSIVIKSEAVLSGPGTVTISKEPVLTMGDDWLGDYRQVVLDCGAGVQLSNMATDFYIVVPPTTVGSFTIEVVSPNGAFVKKAAGNESNKFVRSKILTMPVLEFYVNRFPV